jgi:hypothetical protein
MSILKITEESFCNHVDLLNFMEWQGYLLGTLHTILEEGTEAVNFSEEDLGIFVGTLDSANNSLPIFTEEVNKLYKQIVEKYYPTSPLLQKRP